MVKVVYISNYKVSGVFNWPLGWEEELFGGNPPLGYFQLEPTQQDVDIGWRYEFGDFLPPLDVVINYGSKITKLAFLNRLGDTVLGMIEAASRVNNPLGYAAAVIKVKHASSTYIDLSLDETKADMQKLVDYGFINLAKKNEVLDTPVQEKEVPIFISNITL